MDYQAKMKHLSCEWQVYSGYLVDLDSGSIVNYLVLLLMLQSLKTPLFAVGLSTNQKHCT